MDHPCLNAGPLLNRRLPAPFHYLLVLIDRAGGDPLLWTACSHPTRRETTMSKRDWRAFRAKVEAEYNRCRVCGQSPAEAAHLIARSQVSAGPGEDPRNCVPLCRRHHDLYDRASVQTGRTLDIAPYLTKEEASYAVQLVGLERAYTRLVGGRGERPCSCASDSGGSSDGPF